MAIYRARQRALFFSPASLALPSGTRCLAQPSGVGKSYTATGTNTDTVACADAADGWVGKVVRFTHADDDGDTSDVLYHTAWVTSVSAGTSFEIYPAAPDDVASGDTFQILDSPVPVIVEDGGGASTTTTTDASYGGSNDAFNGYFLLCIKGSNIAAGECKRITDYNATGGVFTTDAFSANNADGDVFLCVMPVAAEGVEYVPGQEMFDRPAIRNATPSIAAMQGPHKPTLSFQLPLKGAGSAPGDGVSWATISKTPLIGLLSEMFGSVTNDTSEVTSAASNVAYLSIANGTYTQFTAGNAVLVNGELSVISSITDADPDLLNLSTTGGGPNLSVAPATGAAVGACKMIRNTTPGAHYPLTFFYFEDGTWHTIWGATGSVTLDATAGQRVMLSFSFSECQSWDSKNVSCPVTLTDYHYPDLDITDLKASNCRLMVAASAYEQQSSTIDAGLVLEARADSSAPEGSRGGLITDIAPTASLTGHPRESDSLLRQRQVRASIQVLWQYGSRAGHTVGFLFPASQVMDVTSEITEGIIRETAALTSRKPDENDPLGDGFRIFFA